MFNDQMKYKRETIKAMKKFKATNPWKGTVDERFEKFKTLCDELKVIYTLPGLELDADIQRPYSPSIWSCYCPSEKLILLHGRFSVVTFLHEFAHAMDKNEFGATRWSVNLFRKIFPEKMDALKNNGHCLIRRQ
jgi:hypothetical protein